MAGRSLNKAQLIGNMTRDPELRYTPQGTAVCTFGLATNRTWTTDTGEKKEDTEFHRIVAWNKLAELCSQLLFKGRRVYVEGRLQTRSWMGQDGVNHQTTEIVIEDMIILDNKRQEEAVVGEKPVGGIPLTEEPVLEGPTTTAESVSTSQSPAAQTPADDSVKPAKVKKSAKAESSFAKAAEDKETEEKKEEKPDSEEMPF